MVQKSLALLGLLLFSTYSVAAPVDCTAIECIVSDGGASITTEGGIEKDLVDVFLNGIEHLGEDEYHICDGLSNVPETDGDELNCELDNVASIDSATMDEVTNEIVVNFSATGYDISISWTLDGSTPDQATIDKQLVLTNTTASAIPLTVLDYTGWDLFNDSANDTAVFVPSNILRQTQSNVTADSIAVDPADSYAVHGCVFGPSCEDVFLDQNSGGNLNNNAGPVGPNAEYSWQNNVTLAGNGSVTINRRLMISTTATPPPPPPPAPGPSTSAIPTMSAYGLVLTTLGLLFVAARRLRVSKKRD